MGSPVRPGSSPCSLEAEALGTQRLLQPGWSLGPVCQQRRAARVLVGSLSEWVAGEPCRPEGLAVGGPRRRPSGLGCREDRPPPRSGSLAGPWPSLLAPFTWTPAGREEQGAGRADRRGGRTCSSTECPLLGAAVWARWGSLGAGRSLLPAHRQGRGHTDADAGAAAAAWEELAEPRLILGCSPGDAQPATAPSCRPEDLGPGEEGKPGARGGEAVSWSGRRGSVAWVTRRRGPLFPELAGTLDAACARLPPQQQ